MMCEVPLTPEQRDYAAKHHKLVYKYLNAKCLSKDEFYDVVIFGYLNAIKRYFTEDKLKKYKFSTIAWSAMDSKLINYYKYNSCTKRNAEILSLHSVTHFNSMTLNDTISSSNPLMEELENRLLLHDISNHLTKQQLTTVRLKFYGYNTREIAHKQKITTKQVKELLDESRNTLLKLAISGE